MAFRTLYAARKRRRLVVLIAKEVANVIPTTVAHLQTMQPQAPATTSRCTFKRSGSNKKKRKNTNHNKAVITPVAPITQIARSNKRQYMGIHPRCNRCNFHHVNDSPCRFCTICGSYNHYPVKCRLCTNCGRYGHDTVKCRPCTNCGRYGHDTVECREQRTQQPPAPPSNRQTKSQYPLRACINCGDPTHYRNTCPECWETTNPNTTLVSIFNVQASVSAY